MANPSVVAHTTTGFAGDRVTSYSRTLSAIAAGDVIILHHVATTKKVSSVADNFANHYSWSKVKTGYPSSGTGGIEVWVGKPPTTGTAPTGSVTVTVTLTGGDYAAGELYQVRSATPSAPVAASYEETGDSTSPTTGSHAAPSTGDLVMAFVSTTSGITANPGSPWTTANYPLFPGTTHQYGCAAWQTGTGGTNYSASWTCGSGGWGTVEIFVAPLPATLTGKGSVAGSGALSGSGKLQVHGVGIAVGGGTLRGSGTLVVGTSSSLTAAGVFTGKGALVLHGAGELGGGGVLGATAKLSLQSVGELGSTGILSGASDLVLTGSGELSGVGLLDGVGTYATIGDLYVTGVLTGTEALLSPTAPSGTTAKAASGLTSTTGYYEVRLGKGSGSRTTTEPSLTAHGAVWPTMAGAVTAATYWSASLSLKLGGGTATGVTVILRPFVVAATGAKTQLTRTGAPASMTAHVSLSLTPLDALFVGAFDETTFGPGEALGCDVLLHGAASGTETLYIGISASSFLAVPFSTRPPKMGKGTLAATGTLTGKGTLFWTGAGELSGGGTLKGAGGLRPSGRGGIVAAGLLTGTAVLIVPGKGDLSGTGGMRGAGELSVVGAGHLAASGALQGDGAWQVVASGTFQADGELVGTGTLPAPHPIPTRGIRGNRVQRAPLVQVERKGATGDAAHFARQIVKRPWQL